MLRQGPIDPACPVFHAGRQRRRGPRQHVERWYLFVDTKFLGPSLAQPCLQIGDSGSTGRDGETLRRGKVTGMPSRCEKKCAMFGSP